MSILQRMQNYTHSRWVKVLLGIIILSFIFWGADRVLFNSSDDDQTVLTIEGYKISKINFLQDYQRLAQQLNAEKVHNPQFNLPNNNQLKQIALQDIIQRTLLKIALEKQGYRIDPEELVKAISNAPNFQENGHFSAERFREVLSMAGYSEAGFFEALKSELLAEQFEKSMRLTAWLSPKELTQFLIDQHETRQFFMINVSNINALNNLNNLNLTISEQAIKADYLKNKNNYLTPKMAVISYVKLPAKNLKLKNQLINLSYAHPHSLAAIATALKLPIYHINWGDFPDINTLPNDPIVKHNLAILSTVSVAKQGLNSPVITLKNGDLLILRVDQQPVRILTLAEATPLIKNKLLTQQSYQNHRAQLDKIIKQLNQATSFEQVKRILRKNHLQLTTLQTLTANNSAFTPNFKNALFSLKPPQTNHVTATVWINPNNHNSIILILTAVEKTTITQISPQTSAQILDLITAANLDLYWQYLLTHAKIVYHQQALKNLS